MRLHFAVNSLFTCGFMGHGWLMNTCLLIFLFYQSRDCVRRFELIKTFVYRFPFHLKTFKIITYDENYLTTLKFGKLCDKKSTKKTPPTPISTELLFNTFMAHH